MCFCIASLTMALSVSSFEMVSDGKYHVAELIAVKKNFTMRVDHGLARSIINEGEKDFLRLTTPLYIGGIPPEPGQDAFNHWHLRNLTSFHGQGRKKHYSYFYCKFSEYFYNFEKFT